MALRLVVFLPKSRYSKSRGCAVTSLLTSIFLVAASLTALSTGVHLTGPHSLRPAPGRRYSLAAPQIAFARHLPHASLFPIRSRTYGFHSNRT